MIVIMVTSHDPTTDITRPHNDIIIIYDNITWHH